MDSILRSIKSLLGVANEDTNFDNELIMHINSAITVLTQLGVGPDTGFKIIGYDETWSSLIGDKPILESAKTITYLRVRNAFDPPQTSFQIDSFKKQCEELEWRLDVAITGVR
jgi:hypothetical protein